MKHRVAVVKTDIGIGEAAKRAVELLGGIGRFIQCFCCVELCPHGAMKAIRSDE